LPFLLLVCSVPPMNEGERSLFMTQIAVPLNPQAGFPDDFVQLIRRASIEASPGEKTQFYQYLGGKLLQALPWIDRGIWDFYGNTSEATQHFADWEDTLRMKEARKEPLPVSVDAYRGAAERRFVLVCAAFLLDGLSGCSQHIERTLSTITEDRLWRRSSFDTVFRLFYTLNFASIQADVCFVIPGDPEYALTERDLAHDDYSFFRPLVEG
jgi:hypothetical protein